VPEDRQDGRVSETFHADKGGLFADQQPNCSSPNGDRSGQRGLDGDSSSDRLLGGASEGWLEIGSSGIYVYRSVGEVERTSPACGMTSLSRGYVSSRMLFMSTGDGTRIAVQLSHAGRQLLAGSSEARQFLLRQFLALRVLRGYGVQIETGTTVKEFLPDGVVGERNGRAVSFLGFDTVVLAMGVKSVDLLKEELSGNVQELFVIGDALSHRGKR